MEPGEYYFTYLKDCEEFQLLRSEFGNAIEHLCIEALIHRNKTVGDLERTNPATGRFHFVTHDSFDIDYFLKKDCLFKRDPEDENYYQFEVDGASHTLLNLWYVLHEIRTNVLMANASGFGGSEKLLYEMFHMAPRKPTTQELANERFD